VGKVGEIKETKIENKETDRNVREKNEDLVKRVWRKARNVNIDDNF
jgi:hypothetical protein